MLDFIQIVDLGTGAGSVSEWLGPFAILVSFALNLIAVGIIIGVAFRIAIVAVKSIMEFNSGEDGGFNIVMGAIRAIAATAAAGAIAFLLTTRAMPILLDLAKGSVSSTLSDPATQGGAVHAMLGKMPFIEVIFNWVQKGAQMGTIVIAGYLLAKTGFDAINKIQFSQGVGNQFDPVKTALKRAGSIAALALISFLAVTVGPDILFTYLSTAASQVSAQGVGG